MNLQSIFETRRLIVRRLKISDLDAFHKMQSNPKVMQYVTGKVKSLGAHQKELIRLINFYEKEENDFWIYAVVRKSDNEFLGTVALIKDDEGNDELGYRFLEKYWRKGYGLEVCQGLIAYCQSIKIPVLIGYVVDKNIGSSKILEKCNFKAVEQRMDPRLKVSETIYQLIL